MSLLTDTDLSKRVKDKNGREVDSLVIDPFDDGCLTPLGYDLRVGKTYTKSDIEDAEKNLNADESISINPGTTALISTLEYIQMPENRSLTGLVESKASQVSKGLSHVSTTVDPDWEGRLLIAIHNHSSGTIDLEYGEPFCTIIFLQNTSPSTRSSDKNPDRLDILLNQFGARSKNALKRRKRNDVILPAILFIFSVFGFSLFGNNPGFIACVALGTAVSQFAERRLLR